MKSIRAVLLATGTALASLVGAAPCMAADPTVFLWLEGIPGESTDDVRFNHIEVLYWGWALDNPGGKANIGPFQFAKRISSNSPQLQLRVLNGRHIPYATLEVVGPTPRGDWLSKLDFFDVRITKIRLGGKTEELRPIELVTFVFSCVELRARRFNPDGTSDEADAVAWDIEGNEKVNACS